MPLKCFRVSQASNWAFAHTVKSGHPITMVRIRTFGRFRTTSRALFICPHELFAIFKKAVFWGGLKPPLPLFISGTNGEEDHVARPDWMV